MSNNTNTRLSTARFCRQCKFYRGLRHTFLDHNGFECETRTNERCVRKSPASMKAECAFLDIRPECYKSKAA